MRSFFSKLFQGTKVGLAIGIGLSSLFLIGVLGMWQNRASDLLFQAQKPNPDIVVIAIDDKSIQELGRWPWDRTVYAQLLETLGAQPKAIGIDVTFSEPSSSSSDDQLAAALRKWGDKVVLASEGVYSSQAAAPTSILHPLPNFLSTARTGVVNVVVDEDNVVRRFPWSLTTKDQLTDHFATTLYRLSDPSSSHLDLFNQQFSRIYFVGSPHTFPMYSFTDVLKGRVSPETFHDKIVLIGATAHDLHDEQLTPVSSMPMSGIEIQANIVNTLASGKALHDEPKKMTVVVLILGAVFLSILFLFTRVWMMAVGIVLLGGAYFVYSFFSFDQGIIRNLLYPPLMLFSVGLATIIEKYWHERSQKRYVKRALTYYLSPSVMNEVLKHKSKLSLGGTRKEMTVLFSDIANFTSIAEGMEADTLAQMLNIYLTEMTGCVFKFKGVLDKYIGDAVMAFWGAPVNDKTHALHACEAALEMQEKVRILQPTWRQFQKHELHVRVGINTGEMVVGNMGSQTRFDYTVIGDNVNLGSRLEGLNKEYGTKIIISEATFEEAKKKIFARRLDTVAVKGKSKGVVIYELRGLGKATPEETTFLQSFEKARMLYAKGLFDAALEAFTRLHEQYPEDGPISTYLCRCQLLAAEPPKSWDGIYYAKQK